MTATKQTSTLPVHRYTLVVDLDRCTGCGSCATACAVENNIPPATERSNERTGVLWMRVHDVTTVEGLMRGEDLGPTQQAFAEDDAFQCGYCTPGQIMAAEGLIRQR